MAEMQPIVVALARAREMGELELLGLDRRVSHG